MDQPARLYPEWFEVMRRDAAVFTDAVERTAHLLDHLRTTLPSNKYEAACRLLRGVIAARFLRETLASAQPD